MEYNTEKQPFNLNIETFEQKHNYPVIIGGLLMIISVLGTTVFFLRKRKEKK